MNSGHCSGVSNPAGSARCGSDARRNRDLGEGDREEPPPVDEVRVISAQVIDVTERRTAERLAESALGDLEYRSTHDALTGLPNRSLLLDILARKLARQWGSAQRVSVLYCDIDNFKFVNDEFSHAAGDELLVAMADRLRSQMHDGDALAGSAATNSWSCWVTPKPRTLRISGPNPRSRRSEALQPQPRTRAQQFEYRRRHLQRGVGCQQPDPRGRPGAEGRKGGRTLQGATVRLFLAGAGRRAASSRQSLGLALANDRSVLVAADRPDAR